MGTTPSSGWPGSAWSASASTRAVSPAASPRYPPAEIVARIDAVFPLDAVPDADRGSEPAARWRYRDSGGEIGVITTVTDGLAVLPDGPGAAAGDEVDVLLVTDLHG